MIKRQIIFILILKQYFSTSNLLCLKSTNAFFIKKKIQNRQTTNNEFTQNASIPDKPISSPVKYVPKKTLKNASIRSLGV